MSDTTRWPAYSNKLAFMKDLLAMCGNPDMSQDVYERMNNSTPTGWNTDQGSYIDAGGVITASGASPPSVSTRYPGYADKASILAAIALVPGRGEVWAEYILQNMNVSDPTSW